MLGPQALHEYSCGSQRSSACVLARPTRMAAPTMLPSAHASAQYLCSGNSRNDERENTEAANITPAPKPNRVSCVRSETRSEKSTRYVARTDVNAATLPPASAPATRESAANHAFHACRWSSKHPPVRIASPRWCRASEPLFGGAAFHRLLFGLNRFLNGHGFAHGS